MLARKSLQTGSSCIGLVKSLLQVFMPYRGQLFSAVCLFGFFSIPQSYAQNSFEDVKQLLLQSSRSIKTANYHGFFTYQHGSVLDSVEIVHRYENGRETETVKHLNGAHRAFTRSSGAGCNHSSVNSVSTIFPALALFQSDTGLSLSDSYAFYLRGTRRYADRPATVIQLVPKDKSRYGLMMALDQVTGLPLMIVLLDTNNSPLERFQFIHVNFALPLDLALDDVDEDQPDSDKEVVSDCNDKTHDSRWIVRWVPKGFVLAEASVKSDLERLHYTDGVASFTLFIGPKKRSVPSSGGASRRGATTAVMTLAAVGDKPIHISLVGEVPLPVARQVIESVYLKP